MITRRHLLAAALLATAATGSSCTSEPEPEPTALPTPSAAPTDDPTTEDDEPSFSPTPTDDASTTSARKHAIATLEALWATNKSQDQWYEDLSALMTPEGGAPFEYTLVENVSPAKATGSPEVAFLDEGNTAQVTVSSTEGDWTLTLYRDGDGWLTESITFPNEED